MKIIAEERKPSGSGRVSQRKKWRFYDQMSFVRDTMLNTLYVNSISIFYINSNAHNIIRGISFCRTISNESQRQSFSEEDVSSSSPTGKHFYSFNSREVFDNKMTILQ